MEIEKTDIEQVEIPVIPVEQPEAVIETEKPVAVAVSEMANLSLAKQVNLFRGQIKDLQETIQQANEILTQVEAENKELKAQLAKALEAKTEIEKVKAETLTAIKGLETTIAEQEKTIKKQSEIIDLKEYKEITQGTKPVAIIHGEAKTILETYRALKGNERFDFYKTHESAIIKELRNR